MSVLRDLTVDFINAAMSAKDSKSKVFQLEQIREILLHRQSDLVPEFSKDVLDFKLDKSSVVRKFLLTFASELFLANPVMMAGHIVNMFEHFLSDSNDSVLATMAREITKIYAQIVLTIANSLTDQSGFDPRQIWQSFRLVTSKLVEYVASARSESLKLFGLQLVEAIMLFGIPAVAVSSDPRLARKVNDPRLRGRSAATDTSAASTSSTGNKNTAEEIALHHAFISKVSLASEAEELFSKVSLWCAKGGPQNFPFSPKLMAVLGKVMAAVGTQRPSHGLNAAKAVTVLLTAGGGKKDNNAIQAMTTLDKEQLARAAARLLRATTVYAADSEGQMTKLKTALNSLGITTTSSDTTAEISGITGKKREYAELMDGEGDNELIDNEEHQAAIQKALNNAEHNKKQLLARSSEQSEGIFQATRVDPRTRHTAAVGEFTELTAELVALQSLTWSSTTRFVNVIPSTLNGELICVPLMNFEGKEYADLALFNLLRLMDSFASMRETHKQAIKACQQVLLRTVLSLTVSALEAQAVSFMVPVVVAWAGNAPLDRIQTLPTMVYLPRALWLFISFALQLSPSSSASSAMMTATMIEAQLEETRRSGVSMLCAFCNKLWTCWQAELLHDNDHMHVDGHDDSNNNKLATELQQVYESAVLAILSRLMQITYYRPYAADFLCTLKMVPITCFSLLIVLQITGTKTISAMSSTLQRGMRHDALSALGALIFGHDRNMAKQCLQYLLAHTLTDDFKMRARIVDLIVSEVIHRDGHVDDEVITFAMHALVSLLGVDTVREGLLSSQPDSSSAAAAATSMTQSTGRKFSLAYALQSYDAGARYEIDFASHFTEGKYHDNFVKAVHMLEKLCGLEPKLLLVLVELFCLGVDALITDTTTPHPVSGEPWTTTTLVKSKLKVIIGELVSRTALPISPTKIFQITRTCSHSQVKHILVYVLQLLLPNVSEPPRNELVVEVLTYLGLPLPSFTASTAALTAAATSSDAADTQICELVDTLDDSAFLLLSPIIGGLPSALARHCLPRLVKILASSGDSGEALKMVFSRLTRPTASILTRAQLLIALLRIDPDAHSIDKKAYIDIIAVCQKNKSEYTSKVVKEALEALLQDETPPFAIMRMAILAADTADMKTFVLSEVIPAMVRKQVWKTAPRVWEGVLYGARQLAVGGTKGSELTLRALLNVPHQQLVAVLRIASNLISAFAKILQAATPEEKDHMLRGLAASGDKVEKEKEKIFKDLIDGKIMAPAPAAAK